MQTFNSFLCFSTYFLFFYVFPPTSSIEVSDKEILNISRLIWQSDDESLKGEDIEYHTNGSRLFHYVNETKLTKNFVLLEALFDNYDHFLGNAEKPSINKLNESIAFLNSILTTPPMKILHQWLLSKGLARNKTKEFKKDLMKYWFSPYSRSSESDVKDSSGFEHVFVGEIKQKNKVTGFHNWLFAYRQEQQNLLEVSKFLDFCSNDVVALSFDWNDATKPISSIILGASPQSEMSLYTLCLLTRPGQKCQVELEGNKHNITTHTQENYFTNTAVGTSYFNCRS